MSGFSRTRRELMHPDPQFRADTARGAEVRTAERVSKIQRVVSICEIRRHQFAPMFQFGFLGATFGRLPGR